MRDAEDVILYVGKAVNLHNRVRSYFRENIGRGPKIDRMVSLIDHFEYIVTDSELEALVLENNLIKEHRPKYNTMLMDDKTYPYIKVTLYEAFPRIIITRNVLRDKAKYFGPYTSGAAVRDTVMLISKLYGLRTCNKALKAGTDGYAHCGRECLNYHIEQCSCPCAGRISREDYMAKLEQAMDFLGGNYSVIQRMLKEKMQAAAEALEYEQAAKYRDLLESVLMVSQKQKIEDNELGDRDIIGVATGDEEVMVQVFFVRGGRMVGREHYSMNSGIDDYMGYFISQFYSGTPFIPREIFVSEEVAEADMLEQWLTEKRGAAVHIVNPKKGQKEKLVNLAVKNACLILNQDLERIKLEEARTIGAVHEIEELLGIPLIERMEAFDISNTSGFENVASMVVFEGGKPKKSDYRKYKMKTVSGPDDYACMREVIMRRFTDRVKGSNDREVEIYGEKRYPIEISRIPPLILMDGGRGQVNIALEVLKELGLKVPVAGMVKDDNHHTRGIYYNNIEMPIDTGSEGFKLITRVQDEAHRFAIEYHRSLRKKDQVHSVLDDIPGIGPKWRTALMKSFSSLEEIKNADISVLQEKAGLNIKAATSVYDYFKNSINS